MARAWARPLTAFVVGIHGTHMNSGNPQFRFEIYAREKTGAGASGDWIQLGNPDNAAFTDLNSVGSSLFLVDQGVRWIEGSLLRGSVFETDTSNRLIHLFHDNNGWQWDAPEQLPQPPLSSFDSFGHLNCENDERHKRGTTKDEKGWTVSEMIDDLASSQPTQRGADPLHRCDGTLGKETLR